MTHSKGCLVQELSKGLHIFKDGCKPKGKIKIYIWPLGTLTRKSNELVDVMRKKINTACNKRIYEREKTRDHGKGFEGILF